MLKGKRQCFSIFYDVNTSTKSKTVTVNFVAFLSVKFRKICQDGSKYFTLVGARFSGKSLRPFFFCSGKRQKSKKLPVQTLLFFVSKIRIPQNAMCCKNFGRFYRRKFKKITSKALKK